MTDVEPPLQYDLDHHDSGGDEYEEVLLMPCSISVTTGCKTITVHASSLDDLEIVLRRAKELLGDIE